jgi:hypothetical protein
VGAEKETKLGDGISDKRDKAGNLITSKNGFLGPYQNTYMYRLSYKNTRPAYESLKMWQEDLSRLNYEIWTGQLI